ncbi:MAG: TRAP transporter substrate-binding protein [Pseudomonadota bacterium]
MKKNLTEVVRVRIVLFVFLCAGIVLGFMAAAEAESKPVIELSYASFLPAGHLWFHSICKPWAEEVERRSNGRVKINMYPGGTLVSAKESYGAVKVGICDIATGVFNYTPGQFPMMEAFDLPLGVKSSVVGTRVLNEVCNKFKPKELDDTKVLYLHVCSPKQVWSTIPLRNLQDLQGVEIRTSVPGIWKALGAVPVAAPQGEVYEMLQKGIVKGNSVSLDCLRGFRQAEVVHYITLDYLYVSPFFVVMNKAKWQAFPEDIKQIFTDVSKEWVEVAGKVWDEDAFTSLGWAVMTAKLQVIQLPDEELAKWHKQVDPLVAQWVEKNEAEGLPARKWVDEIRRLQSK